jgi:hypothetical protein
MTSDDVSLTELAKVIIYDRIIGERLIVYFRFIL